MSFWPQGVSDYFHGANVALLVALAEDPEAKIVDVNERFVSETGYSREDVIGHNCRFMQRHLTRQPGVMRIRDFMRDPSTMRVRTHLINYKRDGSPYVNLLTLTRLKGQRGTVRYILGTIFDVTSAAPSDLLEYEELRQEVGRQLASSDNREMLMGSLQSMSEAATSITQAKLLIDEAERAGMLG